MDHSLLKISIIIFWRIGKRNIQMIRRFFVMAQDQKLKCKDCGQTFVFTTGEQDFYKEKGFGNPPVRCKECRQAKKMRNGEDKTNFRKY